MTQLPSDDVSERSRKVGYTADLFKNDLKALESLMNNYWLQFDAACQEVCKPRRRHPVRVMKLNP